jgi:hypothetical protein
MVEQWLVKRPIIRISDLNSFVNYNVQFSDADLENISWRFKQSSYEILVDPNQYKSRSPYCCSGRGKWDGISKYGREIKRIGTNYHSNIW